MKKLLIILLGISACVHAQVGCPQRIVKGDPRNHGQEEQMMQEDRQRRIAEVQDEAMSTPGIGTLTLPPRVLVIMTQFKDYTFSTTKAHADSLFNAVTLLQTNIGDYNMTHGSVASYFNDQSLGQYRPKFDIVGPITLNKSYKDFPGTSYGISLTQLACTAVNDSVDFTQYDVDKDGYIDLVFIFYAGFGQNDKKYIDSKFKISVNSLIWPHYSRNGSGTYDGKQLRAYECSNELDGYYSHPDTIVPAGIGILVHEFSHGMGLPDVYWSPNSYTQYQYMGTWDLMDYGCYMGETYLPSPYTGFERWFCGWKQPKMMNIAKNDTLRPISTSGDFGVIATSGSVSGPHNNDTAYWIIENHQTTTNDWYAQDNGLLLYHIKHHNSWGTSTNYNHSRGCVLMPADGQLSTDFVGKQGDCYPYGTLDSITTIAPKYPITAIKQEASGNITFKVCGGAPAPAPDPGPGTNLDGLSGEKATWLNGEKVLINGTLYILRGNKLYTITGNETHIL